MILAGFWADISNHKEFFDGYATKHEFDPLIPDNWYSVLQQDVAAAEDVWCNNNFHILTISAGENSSETI